MGAEILPIARTLFFRATDGRYEQRGKDAAAWQEEKREKIGKDIFLGRRGFR